MTLWKEKVTHQKVGVTSWKDRNVKNTNSTTKEKCCQGVCSGEGEYITHHTFSNENDLDMYPATTCDCSKEFNSLRGLRIYKARWCKQRISPTGECKSNDGLMNQEHPHSITDSITERQRPGDTFSKPRIQWPKGNHIVTWTNLDQELSLLLATHLKGPSAQQMTYFCKGGGHIPELRCSRLIIQPSSQVDSKTDYGCYFFLFSKVSLCMMQG